MTCAHLSVVIPVLNEVQQISAFIHAVDDALASAPITYDFLFVDDGSEDGTWDVLMELRTHGNNINAIRLSRNFGKESALTAGLEAAHGDAVVVMDVDLQHPPELLPEMVRLWQEEGAKVVEARKTERGEETWLKKVSAKTFYSFMNRAAGFDLSGATDYKLLDRVVLDAWKNMPERVTFFRGMCAWMGFKPAVIEFSVPVHNNRQTSWTYTQLIRLAINSISSFTSIPLHIVTILGTVFFVFSLLLGAQTIFMYASGRAVDGFTTVIMLLLIAGSGILIGLGIIGIYLSKIYDEIKSRPRYVVLESLLRKRTSNNNLSPAPSVDQISNAKGGI